MTDLFWPGDERAGSAMSGSAFLAAMVEVEDAWLGCLVDAGIAPASAKADLTGLVGDADLATVAEGAEAGGNPVMPVVTALRTAVRSSNEEAGRWLHKGLTSQDVVDTALMLCVRDVAERLAAEQRAQATALVGLIERHRDTVMAGRTLTQHAVPVTFALKASGWLVGVLDAAAALQEGRRLLVVQVGGAAGTLAASVELARSAGLPEPETAAASLVAQLASSLGLGCRMPWHTSRRPVTALGDALVAATDALGRIASDVALLSRPELGELGEPAVAGRGGSSTMPQKQNPVLSVLVRRAAIAAPPLAATLHTAAALAVDERPDGAWHAEWATLHTLCRYALVAASQTTELLSGLRVDAARMRQTAVAASDALLAERRSLGAGPVDLSPQSYLGAADVVVDDALRRAAAYLGGAGS